MVVVRRHASTFFGFNQHIRLLNEKRSLSIRFAHKRSQAHGQSECGILETRKHRATLAYSSRSAFSACETSLLCNEASALWWCVCVAETKCNAKAYVFKMQITRIHYCLDLRQRTLREQVKQRKNACSSFAQVIFQSRRAHLWLNFALQLINLKNT